LVLRSITNFVLHNKHGDTDIIGIRAPHASEFVKGNRLEEDKVLLDLFAKSGCSLYQDFSCVIAEVKGGKTNISSREIHEKFDLETLNYALNRIGLIKLEQIDNAARDFEKRKVLVVKNHFSIHKILFAHTDSFNPKDDDRFSFLSIEQVIKFLENRMSLNFKIRDWTLFDSNVIQQMIHQAAITG
jgi:hypothetical protein